MSEEVGQPDPSTRRDLDKIMEELRELKMAKKDKLPNINEDNSPLSLEIQREIVPMI